MRRELKKLGFEGWVTYIFDHPVKDPAWYWASGRDWWSEDDHHKQALAYLTRLFENGHKLLSVYSDAQVNQGLWFVANNACSSHMFSITNENLPIAARRHCVEAMSRLYELVFARRCDTHLSHLDRDEAGGNPINLVCYMWWDILPLYGRPDYFAQTEIDRAALEVMETALNLSSIACQESALHGLGHWWHYYPDRVDRIINDFLAANPHLRPELRNYAMNAKQGYVL